MKSRSSKQLGAVQSAQSTAPPDTVAGALSGKRRGKRSVYRRQCLQLAALFASAGHESRVALVAMDYAKRSHRALIANGSGDVLCEPFDVHNSAEGVAFLCDTVASCIKRHGIKSQHVCFGGEDEPAWATNFLAALCAKGELVLRVNALEAKNQRDNYIASTDDLDLLGIAKCLISRKAQLISAHMTQKDEQARRVASLRDLMRQRRRLVHTKTTVQNQIHALVDKLCPGFLDETRSGLSKFSEASLVLMSGRFSAQELSTRRIRTLITELKHTGMSQQRAELKATQIQSHARTALPPDAELVPALQLSLKSSVLLLRGLMAVIDDLVCAMAQELSHLPAAVFTSLPGIGIVLASGLAAELGPHLHLKSFSSQSAYAGIVPGTAQTGGSQSPAVQTRAPRRCNRILKDYLVQAASKQQQYGPPEFKEPFVVMKAQGKHAEFAIARRVLRTLRAMHKQQSIYIPPHLRNMAQGKGEASKEQLHALRAHYHQAYEQLCTKWALGPDWQRFLGEDRVLGMVLRIKDHFLDLGLPLFQGDSRASKRPPLSPPPSTDEGE